ncbi:hypothetical protein N2152v2_007331 [Parachlorella kessleri]
MAANTSARTFDIVVFGATGFTGKKIVQEIVDCGFKGTYALAGRDRVKLERLAAHVSSLDKPGIIVADVSRPDSLDVMAKAAKIVISAVGPFRYWGEPVFKACVENGTHYLDICGEPEFIERMEFEYSDKARQTGSLAASAAGFDSVPADMAVLYTMSLFKPPARCTLVETFLTIRGGASGFKGHYPTWESAVQGFGSAGELGALRKKVAATRGRMELKVPGPKPKRQTGPAFDKRVGAWTLPFMGADASVVRRTMAALAAAGQPVAHHSMSFTLPSGYYKNLFLLFGSIMQWLAQRPWGRQLLLAAPGLFSYGMFTHAGPSEQQMRDTVFYMTNVGHGFSQGSPSTPGEKPDVEIVTRVSGPEPGYLACSIFIVQAAITLLEERDKIDAPGGVFTAGALLRSTTYIDRLQSRGIKFEQVLISLPSTYMGAQWERPFGFGIKPTVSEDGELGPNVLNCPTLRKQLEPRPSPFLAHNYFGGGFVSDKDRVCLESLVHAVTETQLSRRDSHENLEELAQLNNTQEPPADGDDSNLAPLPKFVLRSGPRQVIYYNPEQAKLAIVVVGRLCPGVNDIIRSIVSKAVVYGVPECNIRGIPYGFKGFQERRYQKPVELSKANTDAIHLEGGSFLGTCSDQGDVGQIVKWLDLWSIDMLFVIGGVRGMGTAAAVCQECERAKVPTAVIGIPKSIDNHILLIDKAFGFDTAVEEAQRALMAAKVEASSAYRGVGLVKLAGRQSGFIAVKASLAFGQVDVCLIPEVKFRLEGEGGLLAYVQQVLDSKGHAVICVSEGAGLVSSGPLGGRLPGVTEDITPDEGHNGSDVEAVDDDWPAAHKDVGAWLKKQLKSKLKDADVKYIDPSYLIRSVPANSNDRLYCKSLGHSAVHAAFAGYTATMVGVVNTHMTYLPLIASQAVRRVDPKGALYSRLLASTGQPDFSP